MEVSVISGTQKDNVPANREGVGRPRGRGIDGAARPSTPVIGRLAVVMLVTVVLSSLPAVLGAALGPSPGGAPGATPLAAPLQITEFTASPAEIPPLNSTYLNVTVVGGASPYTYAYTGLPIGCHSANVSSLLCLPATVGTSYVTVTVTDANGSTASNTTHFTVTTGYVGPPVIDSIEVTPSPVAVGQVAEIQVNAVSVSHSVLTFFYFDLPPGCASFNQTPLQCLPSQPGSYHIGIEVSDPFGQPVITHAFVNVTGTAPPGPTSGPAPLPNYLLYGVPVVVLLLAVLLGVFLFRRPRRGREPPKPFVAPPQP
jgi:hypothetical protein